MKNFLSPDINECLEETSGCSHNCDNTEGSYSCSCPTGYLLEPDNHTCTDINECITNNGGCEEICDNTSGSYTCFCQTGYTVDDSGHNCTGLFFIHILIHEYLLCFFIQILMNVVQIMETVIRFVLIFRELITVLVNLVISWDLMECRALVQ